MVHVAFQGNVQVMPDGSVLRREDGVTTIGQACLGSSELRILPDAALPNTANYPTLARYLALEDADGFTLQHLDQTHVITYD